MITLYVVEHKPTGKFLPPVKSYHSTTSQELSSTPRVFYRKQDAVCAAKWWAKGHAGAVYDKDWETGHNEPAGVESIPVEGRKLEGLRLWTGSLEFIGTAEAIS